MGEALVDEGEPGPVDEEEDFLSVEGDGEPDHVPDESLEVDFGGVFCAFADELEHVVEVARDNEVLADFAVVLAELWIVGGEVLGVEEAVPLERVGDSVDKESGKGLDDWVVDDLVDSEVGQDERVGVVEFEMLRLDAPCVRSGCGVVGKGGRRSGSPGGSGVETIDDPGPSEGRTARHVVCTVPAIVPPRALEVSDERIEAVRSQGAIDHSVKTTGIRFL